MAERVNTGICEKWRLGRLYILHSLFTSGQTIMSFNSKPDNRMQNGEMPVQSINNPIPHTINLQEIEIIYQAPKKESFYKL